MKIESDKCYRERTYTKCTKTFSSRMWILFIEKYLGLGSGRLLGSHHNMRMIFHLLPDVLIQQFAVRRYRQLSLYAIMMVGAIRAAPVCKCQRNKAKSMKNVQLNELYKCLAQKGSQLRDYLKI